MTNSHTAALNAKHARLDAEINSEAVRPRPDDTLIAVLKKQKLRIKELLLRT